MPISSRLSLKQDQLITLSEIPGPPQDAVAWLEQAAGLANNAFAPRSDDATMAFARVLLGAAYVLSGRTDDAHAAITAALAASNLMDFTLQGYERAVSLTATPELRRMSGQVVEGLRLAGLRERLDEAADTHIPSDARLHDLDQLDAPTPMTVPGGTVLPTDQLVTFLPDAHPLLLTTASANPTILAPCNCRSPLAAVWTVSGKGA